MKRKLSLVLGVISYTVPPLWAYKALRHVEGSALIVLFPALLASVLLSTIALILGKSAYRALPLPRPKGRVLELLLVSLPLLSFLVLMAWPK